MRLRFIGTGAAFNPALGSNSALLETGDDLMLLDCGETVFAALMHAGLLGRVKGRIVVALTHLHADHCGSLGTLCLYAAQMLKRPLTLVHPDDQARTLLSLMGAGDDQYRLVPSLDEPNLRITPIKARHLSMTAFSYLIGDGVETVYYSGDADHLPAEILAALSDGRVAHAYVDAMAFDGKAPENPPHLPFSRLCDLVPRVLRSKVTVMHFNRDFRAEAAAEGFLCAERDPAFA